MAVVLPKGTIGSLGIGNQVVASTFHAWVDAGWKKVTKTGQSTWCEARCRSSVSDFSAHSHDYDMLSLSHAVPAVFGRGATPATIVYIVDVVAHWATPAVCA